MCSGWPPHPPQGCVLDAPPKPRGGEKKNAISPFFDASRNQNISATIRIAHEIRCLPYAGFSPPPKDYESLKFLDIRLRDVGAERDKGIFFRIADFKRPKYFRTKNTPPIKIAKNVWRVSWNLSSYTRILLFFFLSYDTKNIQIAHKFPDSNAAFLPEFFPL